MKHLFETWTSISLPKRILAGLIAGSILGIAAPGATGLSLLGDVFVSALKAIAPLLVFFLIISSLCRARQSQGGVIRTVILLYLFSTFLAAVIAVIASALFPIRLTLHAAADSAAAPQGIAQVLESLLLNIVSNPISAIADANYIGILAWAVLFGIGLRAAGEETKKMLRRSRLHAGPGRRLDHQFCAVRHPGPLLWRRVRKRPTDFYGIRPPAGRPGRIHAVYLFCDQPDPGFLVHPEKPVPADFELPAPQRHHRLLYQKLRGQYPGQTWKPARRWGLTGTHTP